MNKIKLATVFSGIGAIEHAFQRMNIPHEIVFACDNGDVDIFSKRIPLKKDLILNELNNCEELLSNINDLDFSTKITETINEIKLILQNENLDVKTLKNCSDVTSMTLEKINTLKAENDFNQLTTYKEKKTFVDNLYKKKEKQNKVKQSYFENYDIDDSKWHWNIRFLDGTQYKDQVDIFVGGSPCQSFSISGQRRGLEDTRGTLFYEYARLIKEIQPKVFIYENVKGMLNHDKGNTWKTIQSVFDELGYTYSYKLMNAKDYGIPQSRARIFVVGFRKDLILNKPFEFPKEIPLTTTVKDFLLDKVAKRYYSNNTVIVEENNNSEKTIEDLEKYFLSEKLINYVMSEGTKGFIIKPEIDTDIAKTLVKTMHKMHRASIDNYVTTAGRLRKLTPRECLRLMGFCDSFKITVSDTAMYMQAGNSIVVDVLVYIMQNILESYDFKEE